MAEEHDLDQFCDATEESCWWRRISFPYATDEHSELTLPSNFPASTTSPVQRIVNFPFETEFSGHRPHCIGRVRMPRFTCGVKLLVVCLLLGLFCAVYIGIFNRENDSPATVPTPSPRGEERFDTLKKCASLLTNGIISDDSKQKLALDWFIDGAGLLIAAPSDCQWDTEFGMLYALVVIRETMSVTDSSWFSPQPLHFAAEACSWKRVFCENGKVTKLSFNNAGLHGALPSELGGLVHLKQLDLFTNSGLTSTIPFAMGGLTSLESLKIHETSISGTVPTQIRNLKELKEFLLHNTVLTGQMPKEVCDLHLNALVASCNLLACPCCTKCK